MTNFIISVQFVLVYSKMLSVTMTAISNDQTTVNNEQEKVWKKATVT
jgi:hypothetical protein